MKIINCFSELESIEGVTDEYRKEVLKQNILKQATTFIQYTEREDGTIVARLDIARDEASYS